MFHMPDYNPTESVLSKIKSHYKREKLKKIVNDETINVKNLIEESVQYISKADIVNSINFSLRLINK